MSAESLIDVKGLSTAVRTARGKVPIIRELDLSIARGETLAIIGESGSGKSMTALSLMGLLPRGQAEMTAGEIRFDGRDLARLREPEWQHVRGRDIAMIFQDPMSALNPVMQIGRQVEEVIRAHTPLRGAALRAQTLDLLGRVRIPDPVTRLKEYPHRLSGGMCQRVALAMAIACTPRLLIADEPTTALDVTIQAQLLQLLQVLKAQTGMSMLIITHDFGVVAEMADRVMVMYAGRKVEEGSVEQIFHRPRHPYTAGLLGLSARAGRRRRERLPEIRGSTPSFRELPPGCAFAGRCEQAMDICRRVLPAPTALGGGHQAACWALEEEKDHRVAAVGR